MRKEDTRDMEQSMRENKADNLQKPCLPGVIDSGAMEIMRTMEKAGYPTYIVVYVICC